MSGWFSNYLRTLSGPRRIPYEPVGPEAAEHDRRARVWVTSQAWHRPLLLGVFTVSRADEVIYRTGTAMQAAYTTAFWCPDHELDFLAEGDFATVCDEYGRPIADGHVRLHPYLAVPPWITFSGEIPPWESGDPYKRAAVVSMAAGAVAKHVRGPGRWPHVMHMAGRRRARDAAISAGLPDPEPHWEASS